jgi:Mg-chelatase subunit ChlD
VRSQDVAKPAERVVDDVLGLRGHGTTDLAGALRAATEQLSRSRAARKVTVLLSDCRANEAGDVVAAAAALDELAIVAPHGDDVEARQLAAAVGAAVTTMRGPSSVVDALTRVLDR